MKVAGTAFFTVNGQPYSLRGNFTISPGKTKRESVVGLDGYHGLKEEPSVAFMEADFTDQESLDLNLVETLHDVTITAELINGKAAVLRNASQVNSLELNVSDGQYTARFEGPTLEWIN